MPNRSLYLILEHLQILELCISICCIYIYIFKTKTECITYTVQFLSCGSVVSDPKALLKKMNSCWHCPVYNGVHLILVKRHCTRFSHILPSLWFYCAVRRAILPKSWPNSKRSTLFSTWIVMARCIFCRGNLATFKHQMVDFLI